MKNILICICAVSFFASCAPIYLVDKSEFKAIPKGTQKIIVKTEIQSDSLFGMISKTFSRNGWVVKSDKSSMQISAEAKSVGSGTSLKPMVFVDGNTAYFSGEWGLDQQGQLMLQSMTRSNTSAGQPIKFERSGTTKNDVAFQSLLVLAKKIPGEITYE